METDEVLTFEKEQAYRGIGRNVILFQELELRLKILISHSSISGTLDTISENRERRIKAVEQQTLGNLVNRFPDELLSEKEPFANTPQTLEKPYFELTFSTSIEDLDAWRKRFEELVLHRNNLIHRLIPEFKLVSIENWQQLNHFLEEQHLSLQSELKGLNELLENFANAQHELFEELKQPENLKEFIYGGFRFLLVDHLEAVARESEHPDGWILLNRALKSKKPVWDQRIEELLEAYGSPTLYDYLNSLGIFELDQEEYKTGRKRTRYRIQAESPEKSACRIEESP